MQHHACNITKFLIYEQQLTNGSFVQIWGYYKVWTWTNRCYANTVGIQDHDKVIENNFQKTFGFQTYWSDKWLYHC